MQTGERLERTGPGPARDAFVPLLLLADDSPTQVTAYYQQGELFVLRGEDGNARGITLAIPAHDAVELKAVAVSPALHGQGIGRRTRGYAPGIEENGIPLRDLVWMDQDL